MTVTNYHLTVDFGKGDDGKALSDQIAQAAERSGQSVECWAREALQSAAIIQGIDYENGSESPAEDDCEQEDDLEGVFSSVTDEDFGFSPAVRGRDLISIPHDYRALFEAVAPTVFPPAARRRVQVRHSRTCVVALTQDYEQPTETEGRRTFSRQLQVLFRPTHIVVCGAQALTQIHEINIVREREGCEPERVHQLAVEDGIPALLFPEMPLDQLQLYCQLRLSYKQACEREGKTPSWRQALSQTYPDTQDGLPRLPHHTPLYFETLCIGDALEVVFSGPLDAVVFEGQYVT